MINPEAVQDENLASYYKEKCFAASARLGSVAMGGIIIAAETDYTGGDIALGVGSGILLVKCLGFAGKGITYRRREHEIIANDCEAGAY